MRTSDAACATVSVFVAESMLTYRQRCILCSFASEALHQLSPPKPAPSESSRNMFAKIERVRLLIRPGQEYYYQFGPNSSFLLPKPSSQKLLAMTRIRRVMTSHLRRGRSGCGQLRAARRQRRGAAGRHRYGGPRPGSPAVPASPSQTRIRRPSPSQSRIRHAVSRQAPAGPGGSQSTRNPLRLSESALAIHRTVTVPPEDKRGRWGVKFKLGALRA
jgi:hypothetical protein